MLFIGAASVLCSQVKAGDTKSVPTLTVELLWPKSVQAIVPFGLFVVKISEDGTGTRITEDTLPKDGKYVFSNLAPGRYVVESREGTTVQCGINVHEEVVISADKSDIRRTITVRKDVLTTVKVSLKPEGDSTLISGLVWYGRHPYNRVPVTVLPGQEKDVKAVADQPYTFEYEPVRQHLTSEAVGPVVPATLNGGRVSIPVKVQPPLLEYQCAISETDQSLLGKAKGGFYIRVDRIGDDGTKQYVKAENVGGNQVISPDKLTGETRRLYDNLGNGNYELRASAMDGTHGIYCPLLVSQTAQFMVKDGKAEPSNIVLQLGKNGLGQIITTVLGKDGQPLADMLVSIQDGAAGVYHSVTDAHGRMISPALLTGTYKILAGDDGQFPLLTANVDVRTGINPVLLSYKKILRVDGSIVMPTGQTPPLFEGTYYKGLDFAKDQRFGNRKGTFEISALPEDFPMLIVVYATTDDKTRGGLPMIGGVLLEQPPPLAKEVRIEVSEETVRAAVLTVPTAWAGQDSSSLFLWFCRKGTVVPIAAGKFHPTRTADTQKPGDNESTTWGGKVRLASGSWEVIVLRGTGEHTHMTWVGAVTVTDDEHLRLNFTQNDVRANGTLAQIYASIMKLDNKP